MDFFQVVAERHSTRAYTNQPVEKEKFMLMVEIANQAPSASNLQGYEIFVIRQPARKQALAQAANGQEFIASAPLLLVFCANPARSVVRYQQRGQQLYALQDATIACTYAMLAATALGLATVWVGAFNEEAVRQAGRIPDGLTPVVILPVGYAGEQPEASSRRSLQEIVHEV